MIWLPVIRSQMGRKKKPCCRRYGGDTNVFAVGGDTVANDVGIRVGVEGEKQFRDSLKD